MYDEDRKKEGEHEWLEKKMTCHEIDCKVFPQNPNPSYPLQADWSGSSWNSGLRWASSKVKAACIGKAKTQPLDLQPPTLNPPQVAGVYVCQPCRSHIKWVYVPAPEKAPKHALKLLSCEAMWPSIKVVYGQDYPEDVYHEKGASCSGFGLGKHQLNRIVHGIYNVQTLLLIKANSFMNI